MIFADIPEIERISNTLISVAVRTDEVRNDLRKTLSEVQSDIELSAYPQHAGICESVTLSIEALTAANDILQTLKGILPYIAGEYEANETRNINALSRMTIALSNIHANFSVATSHGQVMTVERTVQTQSSDRLRKLVSESAAEMQITNVAAIGKVINEEYDIEQIEDMV